MTEIQRIDFKIDKLTFINLTKCLCLFWMFYLLLRWFHIVLVFNICCLLFKAAQSLGSRWIFSSILCRLLISQVFNWDSFANFIATINAWKLRLRTCLYLRALTNWLMA